MSTVKLDEVKKHLNITRDDNAGELQAMLDTAEAAIEARVGPLGQVEHTQRVTGNSAVVLNVMPVVSVASVTPAGGTAYDLATLEVDLAAGTIWRGGGVIFGSGNLDIVYTAGRASLPADLRLAVLELVRHFWDTQRGPTRRPGSTASDAAANTIPGAAYIFPFRVEQLLLPHTQLGFA